MAVYFIRLGEDGPIKIGSGANPYVRLAQLQSGSPAPLHLLATTDGGRARERELHKRFADLHEYGEWFRPEPPLTDFIATLTPVPTPEPARPRRAAMTAIAAYLSAADISAQEFAHRLGVHYVTVYRWMNGQRFPSPEQYRAIARETRGAVIPNDFFPELTSAAAE